MIEPKVKAAWLDIQTRISEPWDYAMMVSALHVMADAYVEAEWRRRKAEWKLTHRCAENPDWGTNPSWTHCADLRHDWTDNQWRQNVTDELINDGEAKNQEVAK